MPRMPGNNLEANPRPPQAHSPPRATLAAHRYGLLGTLAFRRAHPRCHQQILPLPRNRICLHHRSQSSHSPHRQDIRYTWLPEQVKTDGGPPFNGSESHEYQQYMKWAGIKAIQVSPDDPEANGLRRIS